MYLESESIHKLNIKLSFDHFPQFKSILMMKLLTPFGTYIDEKSQQDKALKLQLTNYVIMISNVMN